MILHIITATGPAFPTLPGKEKDAVLFLSEKLKITNTNKHSFHEARNNIEKADQVVVTNVWDPYAYIELGIAIQLQKKLLSLEMKN